MEKTEQLETKHIWHAYQDELVYALGRLQAFDALANIELPEARRQLWVVFLACGSLQARQRYGNLLTQLQVSERLRSEVAQVLGQRFGLSMSEREAFVESAVDAYFGRL